MTRLWISVCTHGRRDETENRATIHLVCDREERQDPASIFYGDDDDRLNPPGPQVGNKRSTLTGLQLGIHTLCFKQENFTMIFKKRTPRILIS